MKITRTEYGKAFKRGIVAEFYKGPGGRIRMNSLTTITKEFSRYSNEFYLSRTGYDVDYSRVHGYIYHQSSGGGKSKVEVSGIYWVSGDVKVVETPCYFVDGDDKPPWKSKRTVAIRKRNRTRRLAKIPKYFHDQAEHLKPNWDLLDWLENRAIEDESVYCSTCRDYMPGNELCNHCWWCENSGDYSTPGDRCKCSSREKCESKGY